MSQMEAMELQMSWICGLGFLKLNQSTLVMDKVFSARFLVGKEIKIHIFKVNTRESRVDRIRGGFGPLLNRAHDNIK